MNFALDEDLTPRSLFEELNKVIVGQDKAKKALCTAIYNHYKRVHCPSVTLPKSNVLMIGPTGCGKTLLLKTIANLVKVPIAFADATTLTQTGWHGDDVESVLIPLLQYEYGQYGIVYIDEIDKLGGEKDSHYSLSSTKGVQQCLLTMIEGRVARVPSDKSRNIYKELDTTNILFILGGSFPYLDEILRKRCNKTTIGFNSIFSDKNNIGELRQNIKTEDLIEYGFIPEFLGRLPVRTVFTPLTKGELRLILTKPTDSLTTQYITALELEGIDLDFSSTALDAIVDEAYELGTGARALSTILEEIMQDIMFEAPTLEDTRTILITGDHVHRHYKRQNKL